MMKAAVIIGCILYCLLAVTSCQKEYSCENCSSNSFTPVVTANRPPVAKAGADQTISLPANAVDLDGSASFDPDSNMVSYLWRKISGPSCTIVAPRAVSTRVENLVEGSYGFELKVTDAGGLFSLDTVQIVSKANTNTACFNDRPRQDAKLLPFALLNEAKSQMSLAAAADKIVFAGGWTRSLSNGSVVFDLYEISSKSWSLHVSRSPHLDAGVAVYGNKIVYAGGGYFYGDYYPAIDIYDAVGNIWTSLSFSDAKTGVAAAAVGNKIVFAGGFKKGIDFFPNNIEDRAEIYEPSTNSWQQVRLSEGRGYITAVTVGDKAYFAGGFHTDSSNKIDIYDAALNKWSVSELRYLKTAISAIAFGNKIYWTDGSCRVEVFDVSTGTSRLEFLSRPGKTTAVIKDSKIIFVRPASEYVDVFDPSVNTWSTAVLPQQVPPGAAVISVNNIVYVAGGITGQTTGGNGNSIPVATNQVWTLEF